MKTRVEEASGEDLIARLREILQRCEATGEQISFPGEGGERRFRLWLATEFLSDLLGWPGTSVVQGERFDLILRDDSGLPIITIETKTPYREASAKERRDFEKRLAAFPTLRYAIFTNGNKWERYRIRHELGGATAILDGEPFDLSSSNSDATAKFFEPLRYQGKVALPEGYRYRISKGETFIQTALMRLTSDLEACIAESMVYFNGLFHGLREGFGGEQAQSVAEAVYSQWSSESLRVTPTRLAQALCEVAKEKNVTAQNLVDCIKVYGFEGPTAQQVAESLIGLSPARRTNQAVVARTSWPLFEPFIKQLCAQTAHVHIARILLYRVGEDEGVFDERLTRKALEKILATRTAGILGRTFPANEALESVRSRMQTFLPSIYMLGEFDWWLVKADTRLGLPRTQLDWLLPRDEEMERLNNAILQRLNRYSFSGVDVDIWRNLYENYLPEDERQRLGGFYTPDELVDLVLDLAGYKSEAEGLCKLSFIDPSCGSGAFVTTALGRLLTHLGKPMHCHAELYSNSISQIQRIESTLRTISGNVHGVDLHPFASFLTTLNVLFAVLPLYVQARTDNPDFAIDLNIFSWDTLEPPTDQPKDQLPMFAQMNSRVQRTENAFERYKNMIRTKFDRVFGNPPWGGVLKGPLAPVYDTKKKQTFKAIYASTAQGKYDVYGLFMQRSLRLLREGGEFALITQGTFLEKEWAGGLRHLLSHSTTLSWIVDLNPFGHLFFKAMNAPCITIGTNSAPGPGAELVAILSKRTSDVSGNKASERRQYVVARIRELAEQIRATHRPAHLSFAEGGPVNQADLKETANSRWNLSPSRSALEKHRDWFTAADLLEARQGVTPGNCLDIFLLDKTITEHLQLEDELTHPAIKSKDLERWSVEWRGRMLLYPYHKHKDKYVPAFRIDPDDLEDKKLAKRLTDLALKDALDFDLQIDDWERQIVRQGGVQKESVAKLLQHRVALGLIQYPNTAHYLVGHYERLFGRVFEKKRFTENGKSWYEYHRPREQVLMLAKERILSPTLIRSARFALDTEGRLSDHACLFLQPTKKTRRGWDALSTQLETCLNMEVSQTDLLTYCLCFLNSTESTRALTEGRQPTPMGSYQVSEQSLREVPIAVPSDKTAVSDMLRLAGQIIRAREPFDAEDTARDEAEIDRIVLNLLGITKATIPKLANAKRTP